MAIMILLGGAGLAAAQHAPLRDPYVRLIQAGSLTIPVTLRETVGHPSGVEVTCVIPQTLPKVWEALSDYDHLEEVVPFVTESRLIRQDGNAKILYQEGRGGLGIFSRRFTVTFRVHETPLRAIAFEAFEGDFKHFAGFWQLEGQGAGTLVHHRVSIEPAFYMPRWVMRMVVKHMLMHGIEAVVQRCLRVPLSSSDTIPNSTR